MDLRTFQIKWRGIKFESCFNMDEIKEKQKEVMVYYETDGINILSIMDRRKNKLHEEEPIYIGLIQRLENKQLVILGKSKLKLLVSTLLNLNQFDLFFQEPFPIYKGHTLRNIVFLESHHPDQNIGLYHHLGLVKTLNWNSINVPVEWIIENEKEMNEFGCILFFWRNKYYQLCLINEKRKLDWHEDLKWIEISNYFTYEKEIIIKLSPVNYFILNGNYGYMREDDVDETDSIKVEIPNKKEINYILKNIQGIDYLIFEIHENKLKHLEDNYYEIKISDCILKFTRNVKDYFETLKEKRQRLTTNEDFSKSYDLILKDLSDTEKIKIAFRWLNESKVEDLQGYFNEVSNLWERIHESSFTLK